MQDRDTHQATVSHQPGAEFELKSILGLFIRRRWIILGVALPIIFVSTFVTLRTTEQATANARVMLIGRQPETPDFSSGAFNWDLEMSSAAQIVVSLPVAELASEAMFDTVQTLMAEDPTFPDFSSPAEIKSSLVEVVDCMQVGESNILNISYSHYNARYALIVVKYIMEAYMDFSILRLQNQPAVDYYSDQIDNLHVVIEDLFQQRTDIVNDAGVSALSGNATVAVGQIQQLQTSMFTIRSERKALEARRKSIDEAIRIDPTFVPSAATGQAAFPITLKNRIDELATQLADRRSQYTEGSGQIQIKERQLAEVWKELDQARGQFLQDLDIRIAELREKESSLYESVIEQEKRLEGYPDVQRRIEAIDVQIRSQLDLLEALELKRGEVKLSAGADMRVSNIFPLDEPFIKTSVVGSKKTLYLGLAGILAVFLGLIAGWFIDNQDHRIYDRSQAMSSLDVPVLGAISSDSTDNGP